MTSTVIIHDRSCFDKMDVFGFRRLGGKKLAISLYSASTLSIVFLAFAIFTPFYRQADVYGFYKHAKDFWLGEQNVHNNATFAQDFKGLSLAATVMPTQNENNVILFSLNPEGSPLFKEANNDLGNIIVEYTSDMDTFDINKCIHFSVLDSKGTTQSVGMQQTCSRSNPWDMRSPNTGLNLALAQRTSTDALSLDARFCKDFGYSDWKQCKSDYQKVCLEVEGVMLEDKDHLYCVNHGGTLALHAYALTDSICDTLNLDSYRFKAKSTTSIKYCNRLNCRESFLQQCAKTGGIGTNGKYSYCFTEKDTVVIGRGYDSDEAGLAIANHKTDEIRLPLKGSETEDLELFQTSCKKLNAELVEGQFCSLEENLQATKIYASKFSEADYSDIVSDKAKGKEYFSTVCKEIFGGNPFESQGSLFCGFPSPVRNAVYEYSSSKCGGLSEKNCEAYFERLCQIMDGHANAYGHGEKCDFDLSNARSQLYSLSSEPHQNLQASKIYASRFSEADYGDISYDKPKGKQYYSTLCKEFFGGNAFESQGSLFCGFTSPKGQAVYEYSSSKCGGLSEKNCDAFFQRICEVMDGHANAWGHGEKCDFDLSSTTTKFYTLKSGNVDHETCRGLGGHYSSSDQAKTCTVQSSEIRLSSININELTNLPDAQHEEIQAALCAKNNGILTQVGEEKKCYLKPATMKVLSTAWSPSKANAENLEKVNEAFKNRCLILAGVPNIDESNSLCTTWKVATQFCAVLSKDSHGNIGFVKGCFNGEYLSYKNLPENSTYSFEKTTFEFYHEMDLTVEEYEYQGTTFNKHNALNYLKNIENVQYEPSYAQKHRISFILLSMLLAGAVYIGRYLLKVKKGMNEVKRIELVEVDDDD